MDRISNKKLFIITAALVAFLAVSILLLVTGVAQEFFMSLGIYEESEKNIDITYLDYVPKGSSELTTFDDNIIIADQSGVSCFSEDGVWLWSKELNLQNPVILKTDKKIAVADIGGTGIHFFNKNGFTETYLSSDTIIGVSENTVNSQLCFIHKADSYISAVTVLDFTADVKAVATRKFGEYYMSAASIAPSGEEFIVSGIKAKEDTYEAVAVKLGMKDLSVKETVEALCDTWLPKVEYVKENTIVFTGGNAIVIMKGDDKTTVEGKFNGAVIENGNVFTVGQDNEKNVVREYSLSGKKTFEFEIGRMADGISIYKNTVVLFSENEANLYNKYGHFLGTLDEITQISSIEFTGKRHFLVCGGSRTAEVDVG